MNLASRLRSARVAAGFGVRELARRAGRPETYGDISRIEAGKQTRPGADKLAAYAAALGVTSEWLATGARAPADPTIVGFLVRSHPSRWSAAAIAAATQMEADARTNEFWAAKLDELDTVVRGPRSRE